MDRQPFDSGMNSFWHTAIGFVTPLYRPSAIPFFLYQGIKHADEPYIFTIDFVEFAIGLTFGSIVWGIYQ